MLGVFNIRQDLKIALAPIKLIEINEPNLPLPEVSCIFIDWLPKFKAEFVKQAVIVENYVKAGIPIIIYDRFLSVERAEINWLKKFNVSFWEPAINNRPEFEYVPQWWNNKITLDPYIDEKDRKIDLIYDGVLDDKFASFEKYYKSFAGLFPDKNVGYTSGLLHEKIQDYENYNLKMYSGIANGDVSFTILIGSLIEYRIGYLRDDLFDIMKQGVLPLLPEEHRFFGTVFKEVTIYSKTDLNFYINSYKKIRGVLIEEITEKLFKSYPEFKISYITDKIKDYV